MKLLMKKYQIWLFVLCMLRCSILLFIEVSTENYPNFDNN